MLNKTQKLPSMEEFKIESKQLKISKGFDKLGHAQNSLAQKYGFKDYNAIKPKLVQSEPIFNKLPNKITTHKLSTGAIVNSQGLYKTKYGFTTNATISKSYIFKEEVEKALYFIDSVLEKRKSVNIQGLSSYGLKEYAENYIKHYRLFDRDYYISNGAFIVALDIRGYSIKESDGGEYFNKNIKTNYKNFKYNFNTMLSKGEFDYTLKPNNTLPIFNNIIQLEDNNFKNSKNIPSHHFDILENRNTAEAFFEYLSVFIYHMVKAMNSQNEAKFYFLVTKEELEKKFSYLTYDNKLVIKMIEEDMILTNQLLGVYPNVIFDDVLESYIIYWDKKDNVTIETPKNYNTKAYLEYDTYFHKFDDKFELEYHGIIQQIDDNKIYVTYDNLDDTTHEIALNDLDNFIFYPSRKFRDNVHKLVNEASNLEKHQFFAQNKKGYLLAKEFIFGYKEKANFILEKICGYNLDTI